MRPDIEDRRAMSCFAAIVDYGLTLAEECGWRYALAYLVSESISSAIIQRLLSGNCRGRSAPGARLSAYANKDVGWRERNMEEMFELFDSLKKRTETQLCAKSPAPLASRPSASLVEID